MMPRELLLFFGSGRAVCCPSITLGTDYLLGHPQCPTANNLTRTNTYEITRGINPNGCLVPVDQSLSLK